MSFMLSLWIRKFGSEKRLAILDDVSVCVGFLPCLNS